MSHAEWQPKPHQTPEPRHVRPGPRIPTMLGRGLRKKCPACGQGGLFRRWFTISERCPRCGLKFERIEGHWIGAIGMNTIVTFATLLLLLIVGLVVLLNSEVSRWAVTVFLMIVAVTVPPLIDPFTRTFWTAIDLSMRPLEAHEVDWTVVDPSFVPPIGGNTGDGDALTSEALPNEDQ